MALELSPYEVMQIAGWIEEHGIDLNQVTEVPAEEEEEHETHL